MTVSYALRLLCISLASFFLVHLALGALVSLAAPLLIGLAGRVPAAKAAWLLFAVRLYPAFASLLVVVGLCVPSFLWFEPETGGEEVGWMFLGAAALGAAVWSISVFCGVCAAVRSLGYLRRCRGAARRLSLPHEPAPVWLLDRSEPFLVMAGLFRPQLVISQGVVDSLTPDQLSASFEHERAHCAGLDNLKRLVLLLAPGLLPGLRGFGRIENAWARVTEWAADDFAVQGDSRSAVSLAAALVCMARLGTPRPLDPLVTSLMADPRELSTRVDRLLSPAPPSRFANGWTVGSLLLSALPLLVVLQPAATFHAVHYMIERLVR